MSKKILQPCLVSLVELLTNFFAQENSKRINLFWSAIPEKIDTTIEAERIKYKFSVLLNWRICIDGENYDGNTLDYMWSPVNFPKEFWNCKNNIELTQKMESIILSHDINEDCVKDLKLLDGIVFIKEMWRETAILNLGENSFNALQAKETSKILNSLICQDNNLNDETNEFTTINKL